jgi:acyl dehydratase
MASDRNLGDGRITPRMVDQLRDRLNNRQPGRPWVSTATVDTIRNCALAIGDDNPLYVDAAHAGQSHYGTLIAPPMFPYASTSLSASVGGMGFPGIFTLHALDEWVFEKPVRLGDKVDCNFALTGLEEKPSRWGGRAFHQTTEFEFRNQENEILCTYRPLYVRAERTQARQTKKYKPIEPYRYTDEEIAKIGRDYDSEECRGALPRYWEDVAIGDSIGWVVKGPLTVTDMICWWMGMGAPYLFAFGIRHKRLVERPGLAIVDPETNIAHTPEIAHFDEKFARRSGVGSAYDIGRQRTAWFIHLVTNWAGDDAWLKRITARLEAPNYVGDTTWCRGEVVAKEVEKGDHVVRLSLRAETQRGVCHCTGEAVVKLPTKVRQPDKGR